MTGTQKPLFLCWKALLYATIVEMVKRRRLGFFSGLRVLAQAEGGAPAVEFALVTPILLSLLVPLVDLGMAYSQQVEVQQAVQAGAEYATLHPWSSNSATAIANTVTTANNLRGLSATPLPHQVCGCPSGASIQSATCGSTCTNGQIAGYYVVVNAHAPYSPLLPYSVLGSSVTLSAQSTVRTQ